MVNVFFLPILVPYTHLSISNKIIPPLHTHTMNHQYINCILVIILLAVFAICMFRTNVIMKNLQSIPEPFFNYTLSDAKGPFQSSSEPSVSSSFPYQPRGYPKKYWTTPFQSACMTGPDPSKCEPKDMYTCVLTPHNQYMCSWGGK